MVYTVCKFKRNNYIVSGFGPKFLGFNTTFNLLNKNIDSCKKDSPVVSTWAVVVLGHTLTPNMKVWKYTIGLSLNNKN